MSAIKEKELLIKYCTERAKELLQGTGNLPREDLEYVVEKANKMKDPRLQACIAELIKWGDEERAELETLIAICLKILPYVAPSKVREIARKVELTCHLKEMENESTV